MRNNREQAIKRIKILKSHFSPSEDFNRELDESTFNFDLAYKVIYALRPKEHHKTIAVMDSIMKWDRFNEAPKKVLRPRTNKLVKKLLDKLYQEKVFTPELIIKDPDLLNRCTMGISFFNGEVSTKFAIQMGLYVKSLNNMGTEIHRDALMKAVKWEEFGCFWLTELGHGSDVTKLETTAHYDPITKEFILNSPTETSRKFWIGSLALTAKKAVVFTQLIVNGVRYGVHGFLVQIRDPETHKVLPGLTIGDCGDKLGAQGIDNGWIMFDKYRIPKVSLLNKYADISPDGGYISDITSKSKRMAAQFGSLSGGRIAIAQVSVDASIFHTIHALRYQSVRRQFKNPKTKLETRLLDYRINHFRLITKFWHHIVQYVGMTKITEFWNDFSSKGLKENKESNFIHLISSVCKAVYTWDGAHAIGEARQALGGLGFSSYNNFGPSTSIMDLNRTWEGDNNVLMQQAGKLILKNIADLFTGKPVMQTFEFLTTEAPEAEPFTKSLDKLENLLEILTFKAATTIHETGLKLQMSEDKLDAWDKYLAYKVYPMTFSYFNRFLLDNYISWLSNFDGDKNTKEIFETVGLVFAQKIIAEDGEFYRDYLTREQIDELKESIMEKINVLRKEVVGMTYLFPFTDKMYGAVARSEMKPYEYFLDAVISAERNKDKHFDDDIVVSTSTN